MKKIELLKKLAEYVTFSNKTVREITKKDSDYAKLLIYRLKKEGLIFAIEKNKYTLHKDAFIIASKIVWPSYLSCWTALRYYNLTEQLPQDIFVITTRARKRNVLNFENTKIILIKVKPKYFFGFKKEYYDGFTIFIAEPEKALIDSALFKKISFSEIISIVKERKNALNIKKLVCYLLKIKNKTLIKRFGFLLDSIGADFFAKFKKYLDYKYAVLDTVMPKKGKKNKKWRIIENVGL